MQEPSEPESDREARLNDALAEYMRTVDRNEVVDQAEFVQRYPDLADELLELLRTAEHVERMAGPAGDHDAMESLDNAFSSLGGYAETIGRSSAGTSSNDQEPATKLGGHRFGDFEILGEIGQGGMGVVYLARQVDLDRIVALKMIRSGVLASDNDVERFQIEARAAGRLAHPNIIQVHQVGELNGQHFYAMEFVEGHDLGRAVSPGPALGRAGGGLRERRG